MSVYVCGVYEQTATPSAVAACHEELICLWKVNAHCTHQPQHQDEIALWYAGAGHKMINVFRLFPFWWIVSWINWLSFSVEDWAFDWFIVAVALLVENRTHFIVHWICTMRCVVCSRLRHVCNQVHRQIDGWMRRWAAGGLSFPRCADFELIKNKNHLFIFATRGRGAVVR